MIAGGGKNFWVGVGGMGVGGMGVAVIVALGACVSVGCLGVAVSGVADGDDVVHPARTVRARIINVRKCPDFISPPH